MPAECILPMASLAIASLYYTWRDHIRPPLVTPVILRERVAYMLWVASHRS